MASKDSGGTVGGGGDSGVMAVRWWREGDVVAVTSPCMVTLQCMEDSAVPASGTPGTREERPRMHSLLF